MPKTHEISAENADEIRNVRKTISNKKVDKRLYAVQLRGEGLTNQEIADKLDTSAKMVSHWVSAYVSEGISGLLPKQRIGNHRNMSIQEEKELLATFSEQAEAGEMVDLKDLKEAYTKKLVIP